MKLPSLILGKYTGLALDLKAFGRVQLAQVFAQNEETELYFTDHRGVVVKLFDLSCGKADEVSYGPYMSFRLELANYEELEVISQLRSFVPAYYGAHIDYVRKFAYIAMEYLDGQDLKSWCDQAAAHSYPGEWLDEFRRAVCDALSIIHLFHEHGIILIDFKPENIIRRHDHVIKFVDLGAWFTPRHRRDLQTYVYSATPDHAEVLIDASNLQAGVPPTEASDIFSAGVALFELATGTSRLAIEPHTADAVLAAASIYLFRDSQIRDVWRAFPHLHQILPLVQTQLKERRLLFSEVWPLLKAYVAKQVADWETLPLENQDQVILSTGTTFIMEQLPPRLLWLAGPIAHATTLRTLRPKRITDLVRLLAHPAPDHARDDLVQHNGFLKCLEALERPVTFVQDLNTWEVRWNRWSEHWAISAAVAWRQLTDSAQFLYLKQTHRDDHGHRFFLVVVDELEADEFGEGRLTLWQAGNDHFAWLG
ncbi:MAG: hypothetical protein FJ387_20605 [Verrucomicrobia bacterium]|nr:hypothetical protein [Verrucomicrobiota bacterium]